MSEVMDTTTIPLGTSETNSPSFIMIDPSGGDLTIVLIELHSSGQSGLGAKTILARMKVSRKVLIANSIIFERMFLGAFKESTQNVVELEDKNVKSLELWFRVFHKALVDEVYQASIVDVWNAIEISRPYLFKLEMLNDWFAKWLNRKGGDEMDQFTIEELQRLIYPCHEFDHARAFARATRRLVYEVPGHIEERNPTSFRHLHLHQRIIGGMNAARGSLRTKIHANLYINRDFLSANCVCKKDGLFQYELGLDKTGSWPLEERMHGKKEMSIKAILDGLKNFEYEAPNDTCTLCSQDFDQTVVIPAIAKVSANFEGLCLDCIETPKTGDFDKDYVRHHAKIQYDKNCRIRHGQPTWWFFIPVEKAAAGCAWQST